MGQDSAVFTDEGSRVERFVIRLLLSGTVMSMIAVFSVHAQEVRISGLSDFTFGQYAGTGSPSFSIDVCVYSNPSGVYGVTVTGDGPGFAITHTTNNDTISYGAYWSDGGAYVSLTSGSVLHNQGNANTSVDDCGGSTNASLELRFSESALLSGSAGSYSGSMTILVEPE